MKKMIGFTLAAIAAGAIVFGGAPTTHASALTAEPEGKAAYLCDYETGAVVYAKNETDHLPIASMCKIMTLLLTFEAVDRGELAYEEQVTASENAAGMGGSQVFLGANLSYSAEQLMKSVAVCSANDSCVALAERVAGSEAAFVARMNERAKQLGAENTLFANCTGLPKDPQYSCAQDVSLMLRALLHHEKYYEFSRVWLEDFAHPDGRTTSMTNTNKLIRHYRGCDGGKTGFTNEAGFCLAATAKRENTRLIAVVIGAESAKTRNASVAAMFDEGFADYSSKIFLEEGKPLDVRAAVRGAKQSDLAIGAEHALAGFCKRGEEEDYTLDVSVEEDLRAPVRMGDAVGKATLFYRGVAVDETPLIALEDAARFGWWDAYREMARDWAL